MTCAKKVIRCWIWDYTGNCGYGENACNTPQEACPREPEEGYEKCKSICHQPGHAEMMALEAARAKGVMIEGATVKVKGAYNVCKSCAATLRDAKVGKIIIMVS